MGEQRQNPKDFVLRSSTTDAKADDVVAVRGRVDVAPCRAKAEGVEGPVPTTDHALVIELPYRVSRSTRTKRIRVRVVCPLPKISAHIVGTILIACFRSDFFASICIGCVIVAMVSTKPCQSSKCGSI